MINRAKGSNETEKTINMVMQLNDNQFKAYAELVKSNTMVTLSRDNGELTLRLGTDTLVVKSDATN